MNEPEWSEMFARLSFLERQSYASLSVYATVNFNLLDAAVFENTQVYLLDVAFF